MSFEPTLILRKKELEKSIPILEQEQYIDDEDVVKVSKYLIEVNTYETVKFGKLELIICEPEFTEFNSLVRSKLEELEIDFRINILGKI